MEGCSVCSALTHHVELEDAVSVTPVTGHQHTSSPPVLADLHSDHRLICMIGRTLSTLVMAAVLRITYDASGHNAARQAARHPIGTHLQRAEGLVTLMIQ